MDSIDALTRFRCREWRKVKGQGELKVCWCCLPKIIKISQHLL